MTPRQFFDLVAEMRQAQREYFAARGLDTMTKAKALERKVDQEISRAKKAIAKQDHEKFNPQINFDRQ